MGQQENEKHWDIGTFLQIFPTGTPETSQNLALQKVPTVHGAGSAYRPCRG